ncbi:hypothetical protein P280DRAFT_443043 [Massarina eburnea CBS 473.64]|uniref:Diphthamide biosynthesis protein 4 n=1 Tax=Massarina eburnea CBS 473.64 TaxID=1395130 RepID=A0A6A6SIF1_9PLEO|nr:hypothetical protein P280DRAFT_443043 [Massarina eburnea CBS 473.64]
MVYTKNYYRILGLETKSREHLDQDDLKKAYRTALLGAHPDTASASQGGQGKNEVYTVDDVKEAFGVLSDATQRVEYDGWIAGRGVEEGREGFLLGLEVLDLSDFVAGEDEGSDAEVGGNGATGPQVEWTRSCRCGNEKGFRITEKELEDAEGRGEKEVLVGCEGCSLWVRVGFDVEEG